MAIDPVCGMEVEEATAQWTSDYEGKTYYFCARGCKNTFDKNPANFITGGDHSGHGHDAHGGHADHSGHGGH